MAPLMWRALPTLLVAVPTRAFGVATEPLSSLVTVGVKHQSGFEGRIHLLAELISSVRERYADLPLLVAYEGPHVYDSYDHALMVEYIRLNTTLGLSAGRNELVSRATTEYIVIVDDDVRFHSNTHLESLLAHLQQSPELALVAACYHPQDCYAHNFVRSGQSVATTPVQVPAAKGARLTHAHLVQNAFMARTSVLRTLPWDARQELMEHETFFYAHHLAGHTVAFDPDVTLLHMDSDRTPEYNSTRHREHEFVQYLCKNFPRVRSWSLPFLELDCRQRTMDYMRSGVRLPFLWDDSDDGAAVPYTPPAVSCFFMVMSASGHVKEREALRGNWLQRFGAAMPEWDYAFFVGAPNDSQEASETKLGSGADMFGDLVRVPAPDDYARLTKKVLAAMHWTLSHVETRWVLKIDSDTWVDPAGIVQELRKQDFSSEFYGGNLQHNAAVARSGKWAVPLDIYEHEFFPTYAKGGGYVLSVPAATRILAAIEKGASTLVENVEDVTVGLAASAAGIQPHAIKGFKEMSDFFWQSSPPALTSAAATLDDVKDDVQESWARSWAQLSPEERQTDLLNAARQTPLAEQPAGTGAALEALIQDCRSSEVTTLLYHKPLDMQTCEDGFSEGDEAAESTQLSARRRLNTMNHAPSMSPSPRHPFALRKCGCDNFRNGLTEQDVGGQGCAMAEVHGLSGVKTWCAPTSHAFIPHLDSGCPTDMWRCVVDFTAPVFPECRCDSYLNGADPMTRASAMRKSGLCQKNAAHGERICYARNYEGDKEIGGAEFYGCAEDMTPCVPSGESEAN